MNEYIQYFIIVSGTMRVAAFFVSVIAVHDVIRNGLHVQRVPWIARLVFYFAVCSLGLSAMASAYRLAGESWAPVFRELAHSTVSLGIIGVSIMVMRAPTCAGERFSGRTGKKQEFTETGPMRDRRLDVVATGV